MNGEQSISTDELAEIGATLYQGVTYRGRSAWQSWLADGIGVDGVTVRRWLMDDAKSRRAVPPPIASLLSAAFAVADDLQMWGQPRGTLIAVRMASLVRATSLAAARSSGENSAPHLPGPDAGRDAIMPLATADRPIDAREADPAGAATGPSRKGRRPRSDAPRPGGTRR